MSINLLTKFRELITSHQKISIFTALIFILLILAWLGLLRYTPEFSTAIGRFDLPNSTALIGQLRLISTAEVDLTWEELENDTYFFNSAAVLSQELEVKRLDFLRAKKIDWTDEFEIQKIDNQYYLIAFVESSVVRKMQNAQSKKIITVIFPYETNDSLIPISIPISISNINTISSETYKTKNNFTIDVLNLTFEEATVEDVDTHSSPNHEKLKGREDLRSRSVDGAIEGLSGQVEYVDCSLAQLDDNIFCNNKITLLSLTDRDPREYSPEYIKYIDSILRLVQPTSVDIFNLNNDTNNIILAQSTGAYINKQGYSVKHIDIDEKSTIHKSNPKEAKFNIILLSCDYGNKYCLEFDVSNPIKHKKMTLVLGPFYPNQEN